MPAVHRPALAVLLALVASGATAAPDLPKRKPGLWETTVSMPAMPGGAMPAIKMCIDEKTDDLVGGPNGVGRENCEQVDIRREGARYVIESKCRFGETKTHTTGWFEGSFDSDYKGELNTEYSPPMQGMKNGKVLISSRQLADKGKPTLDLAAVSTSFAKDNAKLVTKAVAFAGELRPATDLELLASLPGETVEETLCSHLLKSNCLVTGQPDWAMVVIRYRGAPIDRAGLLRYIVSFRNHNEFHEQCVERIFTDIQARCRPEALAVYARYTRRGGLDINPFRSTGECYGRPENIREIRQ